MAVQFWPRPDRVPAEDRWPSLFDEGVPEDYWEVLERNLRWAPAQLQLLMVPLEVPRLVEFLQRTGLDVDDERTREAYAEEVVAAGDALPWPPRRDAACWCGSGATYGDCCARA